MRLHVIAISLGLFVGLCGCGGPAAQSTVVPQALQPDAFARSTALSVADALSNTVPVIAGTYNGTIDDAQGGPGTVTIVINQSKNTFSGTFTPTFLGHSKTFTFSGGKVYVKDGKTHARYPLTGYGQGCSAEAKGIVNNGHLNGSYASINCTDPSNDTSGTFKTHT